MIGPVELEQVAMLLGLRREQQRLDGLGPGQERTGVPPPGQVLFPASASPAAAHWRTGSWNRNRVLVPLVSASSNDAVTSCSTSVPARPAPPAPPPATSTAAARSNPAGNTLSRRNTTAASADSSA